ncbi:MAG: sporulation protein YunB [Clostridiales bacterium]|jgi:sporulation protein YunB|nr:sporulation protein YunB [Clostridiales bacterium]
MRKYAVKHKKRKWIAILIGLFLLFLGIFLFIHGKTVPIIRSVSEEKARALAVTAVNEAVWEVLGENPGYAVDLVELSRDSNGDIEMIRINSTIFNAIAQRTTVLSQQKLNAVGSRGIEIPLGTLTGAVLLTGKGPMVNFQVLPVGSVNAKFCSTFEAAGVNQTNHKIYLRLSADISVIFPGAHDKIRTVTEVPFLDSVIIGKIPDVYLNSDSLDTMLDLVP